MNETTKSWLNTAEDSDFPIQNIPFGMAVLPDFQLAAVSRIGDWVIDLDKLNQLGFFRHTAVDDTSVFRQNNLNDFIALGRKKTAGVRNRIAEIFDINNNELQNQLKLHDDIIFSVNDVKMLMPIAPGDYTDFYSSIEHATNVGKMFRDPANALLPNWRHLPVGYHGRASSIVVSGTPLHRPKGQIKTEDNPNPLFSPTKELDFELEMAFITCGRTNLGDNITVEQAEDYIFGMVLFNDMSARDIQRWEYVPLGPFLSKSFGSVISPWIVTMDALDYFRTTGPEQEPKVLPYLQFEGKRNFDIQLEAAIKPQNTEETVVSKTNFKYMYWNIAQQLAHQTINGCNINPCDIYASGTISGPESGSYGSLLEICWKGTNPIQLSDGTSRVFLEDSDSMIIRGFAKKNNIRIGFGEVITKVLPAK
ncbi:MAG: fumarylacetoacetase [Bacteroidetes bacterium]|nr:fumarylacetoacetase [Bacteroidota bacterium]